MKFGFQRNNSTEQAILQLTRDIASSFEKEEYILGVLIDFSKAFDHVKKQPSRGVLKKRCSENMQQIYRKTPMLKCDFNKVAKQLY